MWYITVASQSEFLTEALPKYTKSFLRRVRGLEFENLFKESEGLFFNSVMRTEDSKEGIYAFLEKRSPNRTQA